MNSSKKLMKETYEDSKKRQLKKYHNDIWMIVQTSFPAFAYGIIFLLQSIIDSSIIFSIELAFFSCCVTLAFEINEWKIFTKKSESKIKMFNYFTPLLFTFILIMIVSFIYNGFATLIGVSEETAQIIPNFITSLTLFGYFISYTIRSIKSKQKEYLTKKNSY